MSTQTLAILISLLALSVSIGSFLTARHAASSSRFHERWFQFGRLVLDHSPGLLPLWCSAKQYNLLYPKRSPTRRKPSPEELAFGRMYIDFILEVHRRGRLATFLTGTFPGRVPLTNPRMIYLWEKYISPMFSEKERMTVSKAMANSN